MRVGRQACWMYRDDDDSVNSKINSAFKGVKSYPFRRIIFQFWRPVTNGGALASTRNPYAFSPFDRLLRHKYRPRCIKYRYSIIDDDDDVLRPKPAWIIGGGGGPVVSAFRNHFPEVVSDLRVAHQGDPLVVCALECELTSCLMLPVFDACAASEDSECLGVVECSTKHPALLLPMFYDLKRQLERVGLSIYSLQGTGPYYKTISIPGDLQAAKFEIDRALELASELHALTLAQVWIPSSTFLVKLSHRWYSDVVDPPPSSVVKDFYDNFDVISGEGLLARKALQTHQPHLCTDIRKLTNTRGVSALLSNSKSSRFASFVICLRSTHTGDLDYAFEFFWPLHRDHFILLETLLFFTLTNYLPSFKLAAAASGQHEYSVVHVHNSSSSSTPLNIPLGNSRLLSETANTFVGVKRKSFAGAQTDSCHSSLTNQEAEDDGDDDLAILASYRNQILLLYLPTSSTFENLMEKLTTEFELDPTQSYKVEYKAVSGQWSSLACLESFQMIEGTDLVKLRVLANFKEVAPCWISNT